MFATKAVTPSCHHDYISSFCSKNLFFFRKEQDELMVMVYYVLYSLSCPQHECDS